MKTHGVNAIFQETNDTTRSRVMFITSARMVKWLEAFAERTQATEDAPVLLLLDSVRSHVTVEVFTAAYKLHVHLLYIPAGMTPFVQPCDQFVFKAFAARFRRVAQAYFKSTGVDCDGGRSFAGPLNPSESFQLIWCATCLYNVACAVNIHHEYLYSDSLHVVTKKIVARSWRSCGIGGSERERVSRQLEILAELRSAPPFMRRIHCTHSHLLD